MTETCGACDRETVIDEVVVVRGLADVPGIAYVCRECLDGVLRAMRLRPPMPTLRAEMEGIFDPEVAA